MEIKKYVNAVKAQGDAEPVVSYLMDSLLHSRIATGHESNEDGYDEDVNVYLALLMSSLVDSKYHTWITQYVSPYECDIYDRLQYTKDLYVKFITYKVNADYLLLSQGIFDVPRAIFTTPESRNRDAVLRGKAYYQIAGSITRQMREDRRALAEVLQKLSDGYEKYLMILSYMRGEYLGLVKELSPGEMFHLGREVDLVAQRDVIRRKKDEFLDLYGTWTRALGSGKERELEMKLRALTAEIAALDPEFQSPFDPPRATAD